MDPPDKKRGYYKIAVSKRQKNRRLKKNVEQLFSQNQMDDSSDSENNDKESGSENLLNIDNEPVNDDIGAKSLSTEEHYDLNINDEKDTILNISTEEHIDNSSNKDKNEEYHSFNLDIRLDKDIHGSNENIEINDSGSNIQSNSDDELSDSFSERQLSLEIEEEQLIDFKNINCKDSLDNKLKGELISWALKFRIKGNALDDLLKRLHSLNINVPLCSKTLLKTPRKISETVAISEGEYFHFGLEKAIFKQLKCYSSSELLPELLELYFNVDGLQIFKSCNKQFWPILGYINKISSKPFLIGLFEGTSKPSPVEQFLSEFVKELQIILRDGIVFENNFIKFKIKGFICDSPARSFLLCIKYHSGYYGCSKCTQKGNYINNKVAYPDLEFTQRTDHNFRENMYEDHQTSISPLTNLDFDMIAGFPLEAMHLLYLGVMRKLLQTWCKGKKEERFSKAQLSEINDRITVLKNSITDDFARKPRSLVELDRFKATEFRQILLYTGPMLFRNILKEEFFQHYMSLHCAGRILSDKSLGTCDASITYAGQLLKYFVEQGLHLYGNDFAVYNVHSLLHMESDVREHGPLENYSAFKFENFLGEIKNYLRSPTNSLQQIVMRFAEMEANEEPWAQTILLPTLKKVHFEGPTTATTATGEKFKEVYFLNFHLSISSPNNYCQLKNKKILIIKNIVKCQSGDIEIVCNEVNNLESYFVNPLDSKNLNIFKCNVPNNRNNLLVSYSINDVERKFAPLQLTKHSLILYPILHR